MVLLLTVNFRVAHLDRCIESSGPAATSASSALFGSIGRDSRAAPDQPALSARLAENGPVAVPSPLQLDCARTAREDDSWGDPASMDAQISSLTVYRVPGAKRSSWCKVAGRLCKKGWLESGRRGQNDGR